MTRRIRRSNIGALISVTRTALLFAVVAVVAAPADVLAQTRFVLGDGASGALLFEDGSPRPWPDDWPNGILTPSDSVGNAAHALIRRYQLSGYWYAALDSVVSGVDQPRTFYVTRGRPSRVGDIRITGVAAEDSIRINSGLGLRAGDIFDQIRLAGELNAILEGYNESGYPLATGTLEVAATSREGVVDITVVIDRGVEVVLASINLASDVRTKPGLVARLIGLRIGGRVRSFDAEVARRRLEASGLFDAVGEIRLEADALGNSTLTVPLVEADPGNFDLVLGYQSKAAGGGEIVGNGHIVLSNIFGGARTISMKLNRLSGRASIVEAELADPYVLGSSLGAAVSFVGEQRDSTFSKQSYGGELGYGVTPALGLFGSVERALTRPGQVGLAIVGGRQLVPRSASVFAGIGVRFTNVDRPSNPRKGIDVFTHFERGRKSLRTLQVAGSDTVSHRESLRQERLSASTRLYTPIFGSQVAVLGVDAAALLSDTYDEADLLSLGGAISLRGYNEKQFSGRFVARALAEYRYLIDQDSYAFVFADVGYVEPVRESGSTGRSFHPGFGLGIQFKAAVGLINATYAVNTDDGIARGKVHVGLSFAL
jgi:outer membrane protein assembly factor BamA